MNKKLLTIDDEKFAEGQNLGREEGIEESIVKGEQRTQRSIY